MKDVELCSLVVAYWVELSLVVEIVSVEDLTPIGELILDTPNTFKRHCPKCNKELFYSAFRNCQAAEKRGSLCSSCSSSARNPITRAKMALAALQRHQKREDPTLLEIVNNGGSLDDRIFARECPICCTLLRYSNRDHFNAATEADSCCSSCSATGRIPSDETRVKQSVSAYRRYGSVPGAKKNIQSALTTWARHVKKRDNHICVLCGSVNKLEAHHIFSVSKYPDLALVENNGITLCYDCHELEHKINGCL
jgi:hypothetical protein